MQPLGVRVFNRKPYKFCRCAACRPHENDLENGRAREKQHTQTLIAEAAEECDCAPVSKSATKRLRVMTGGPVLEESDAGTLRESTPQSAARRKGTAKKRKR